MWFASNVQLIKRTKACEWPKVTSMEMNCIAAHTPAKTRRRHHFPETTPNFKYKMSTFKAINTVIWNMDWLIRDLNLHILQKNENHSLKKNKKNASPLVYANSSQPTCCWFCCGGSLILICHGGSHMRMNKDAQDRPLSEPRWTERWMWTSVPDTRCGHIYRVIRNYLSHIHLRRYVYMLNVHIERADEELMGSGGAGWRRQPHCAVGLGG